VRRPERGTGPVWALGMMSGTSMDGVDAAMIRTDGRTIQALGESGYRPYAAAERAIIAAALGRWPGEAGVAEAEAVVRAAHAELIADALPVDVVGFHGQTLAHEPGGRGTHQAGDGDLLAEDTGATVVWDFRSADVALGGQGAPFAPFFHHACARRIGETGPVAFLNIGGVANVTWADPRLQAPETPGACLAFDCGPGNASLDDLVRARRGEAFDRDGRLAAAGAPERSVVAALLRDPFFMRMPPKSLDRNAFAGLLEQVAGLGDADAAATLAACTVAAIVRGCEHFPEPPARMLVTGGGRRNAHLMAGLADALPFPVQPVESAGLDGDMLEAQAFGYLAVRVLNGLPTSAPGTTGVAAAVGGGQVSRPG